MIAFTTAIGRAVRAAEANDLLPSDTPRSGGGVLIAVPPRGGQTGDRPRPVPAGTPDTGTRELAPPHDLLRDRSFHGRDVPPDGMGLAAVVDRRPIEAGSVG